MSSSDSSSESDSGSEPEDINPPRQEQSSDVKIAKIAPTTTTPTNKIIVPREIQFEFPWHTKLKDPQLDTSTIDDLRMKLSAAEFHAEERCQILLAQLETCENETEHRLAQNRHEQELAVQEQERLSKERIELATRHNTLKGQFRSSQRELKESEWRACREKEERQADQEAAELRIQESESILRELKTQLKQLRERQQQQQQQQQQQLLKSTTTTTTTLSKVQDMENTQDTISNTIKNSENNDNSTMSNNMIMTMSSIDELEAIQLSIETANSNHQHRQEENKKLQKSLRTAERKLEESNHQLMILETKRKQQQDANDKLQQKIEQHKQDIGDLQYDLSEIKEERKTMDVLNSQKRKDMLTTTTKQLKDLKDLLQQSNLERQEALDRLQVASENEAVQLEALTKITIKENTASRKVETLRVELEHVKQERSSVEDVLNKKELQVEALLNEQRTNEHEYNMKEREKITLARSLEHTNKLNERRLEATIQSLIKENHRINTEIISMNEKKKKLMLSFETKLKREASEGGNTLSKLYENVNNLEHARLQHEQEIADLNQKLTLTINENDQQRTKLEATNELLHDTTEQQKKLFVLKEEQTAKIIQMEEEIKELTNDSQDMIERYDDLKLKYMALETDHERMEKNFNETKQTLRDVQTKESNVSQEVHVLKTCVDSLRQSLRTSEEAAEEATLECTRQSALIEKHEDDKERLTAEQHRLLLSMNDAISSYEQLKRCENEWQKEIASLLADKHKAEQLRSKHQALRRKYGEANQEIQQLKEEIATMQEKLRQSYEKNKHAKDDEVQSLKKRMRFLSQRVNQMAGQQQQQQPAVV